jgi:hypothetical protein
MPPELLPCPFCGSPAYIEEESVLGIFRAIFRLPRLFEIHCGLRQCPVMMQTGRFETEALAIRAWNTRAATPGAAEAIEAIRDVAGNQNEKGQP